MQAFDLHTHSIYSDGTQTPAAIVRAAKEAGLAFVALTDHDTVMGVPEAMAEGARIGMRVVPGVEYDIDYSVTMHILGLGIDPDAPEVKRTLAESAVRRARRNKAMFARLREVGCPIEDAVEGDGLITRLHMANALVKRGMHNPARRRSTSSCSKGGRRLCAAKIFPLRRRSPSRMRQGALRCWRIPARSGQTSMPQYSRLCAMASMA